MISPHIVIKPLFILLSLITATAQAIAGNLPQGRLVKIGIDHTGIYRISAAQLAAMGFETADAVTIYGYGGTQGLNFDFPTRLPEIPTMRTADGSIVFYGEGPERYIIDTTDTDNCYTSIECNSNTTRGCYFVAATNNPRRIETGKSTAVTGAGRSTHYSTCIYHPQTTNPARAGATFLGEDFSRRPDKTINIEFNIPDARPLARMGLKIRGAIKATAPRIFYQLNSGASKSMSANPSLPNYDDVEIYFGSTRFHHSAYTIPSEAPTTVTLTASAANSGDVAYAAIESATLTYERYNIMPSDGSTLSMYYNGLNAGDAISVDNASGVRLWDVTDGTNPIQLAADLHDNTLTATMAHDRTGSANILAFNPDGNLGQVEIMGDVTLRNLSAINVPEMVIISAPALHMQAERLAEIHRKHQGMSVTVIATEDIYNEFGSGSPSPYAIRRFMKSLYDRGTEKLRHLLIMGSATYDPCGRVSGTAADGNYVLTYETEDFYTQGDGSKCYCNDTFYGLLLDNDVHDNIMAATMAITVGRIPAATAAQASAYIDKVERYMTTPPSIDSQSRAIVIGDYGDNNGHLKQAIALSDSISQRWAPHATVTRAMSALFAPANGSSSPLLDKVLGTINNGVGYVAYSGHGNPSSLGSDEFLKRSSISSLSNTVYPMVMLSTCYSLGYDRNENGIAEVFLFNDHGGAIAVAGSGRAVRMNQNQSLNIAMGKEFFRSKPADNLGEVFRLARNRMTRGETTNQLIINTACYNFIGDPALPVYSHTHAIELTDDPQITITPLSSNIINGCVLSPNGDIDTDFNGNVTINLYAPAETTETNYDRAGCKPWPVTRRETLLATTTGRVIDGMFTTDIHCPAVPTPGEGHKISIHAVSDDGKSRAVTSQDNVFVEILPDSPELDDGIPPVINSMWINTPDFSNGDILDPEITVYASITPSATGISLTPTIGRTPYIELDNIRHNDIARHIKFETDGTAILQYPLTGLPDGTHTLTLSVSDNAGNRTENTISFITINRPDDIELLVKEITATSQATISLKHNFTNEPVCRLLIEDSTGNTVFSVNNLTLPVVWDLRDESGCLVNDGTYTARAMIKAGLRHAATPPVTFVVINNNNPI